MKTKHRAVLLFTFALSGGLLAMASVLTPAPVSAACTIPTRSLTPTPYSTACDYMMATVEFRGRVVTARETPVPGARVAVDGASCGTGVTGGDGFYSLQCRNLPWPCTCLRFSVTADGFMPWRESYSLGALVGYTGGAGTVHAELLPGAATLYLPSSLRQPAAEPWAGRLGRTTSRSAPAQDTATTAPSPTPTVTATPTITPTGPPSPTVAPTVPTTTPSQTPTPSATATPGYWPGPMTLSGPADGATIPQGGWSLGFDTPATEHPRICRADIYVDGPGGRQLRHVIDYSSGFAGWSYRTDVPLPDHALGPWHWKISVYCYYPTHASNASETRSFWVEPAPTPDPTSPRRELRRLALDDPAVEGYLGGSIAADGDTVVVGAAADAEHGEGAGAVHVLRRLPHGAWAHAAKITAADARAGDGFGASLAIAGDTLIVGAPGNDERGDGAGAAYVFMRQGDRWSQQAKLSASDAAAGDAFGAAVAIDGDTLVASAPASGGQTTPAGAAYVFVRQSEHWVPQGRLTVADVGLWNCFGTSVAISGETIVVGASGAVDYTPPYQHLPGAAYVFVRTHAGWALEAKLETPVGGAQAGDMAWVVRRVVVAGDLAVVGFDRPFYPPEAGAEDFTGVVLTFTRDGSTWRRQDELAPVAGQRGDGFGRSMVLRGNRLLVGAPSSQANYADGTGAVYLFTHDGAAWAQAAVLALPDGRPDDALGAGVALAGDDLVIGAPGVDDPAPGAGAVFAFHLPSNPVARLYLPTAVQDRGAQVPPARVPTTCFRPFGDAGGCW